METSKQKYQIVFAYQDINSKANIYDLIRETKCYVFLQQENSPHIFRVHKKTFNVKGIKEGKHGYEWDVPCANDLKLI